LGGRGRRNGGRREWREWEGRGSGWEWEWEWEFVEGEGKGKGEREGEGLSLAGECAFFFIRGGFEGEKKNLKAIN